MVGVKATASTEKTKIPLGNIQIKNNLLAGGLNHLPFLLILSISVSMAVIKEFMTNYMKALGLNRAYMFI